MNPMNIVAYAGATLLAIVILATAAMVIAAVAIRIRDEWSKE